jgi:4-hydroxy-3-methylbut-2-enyl diphosphate reductase IspH
VRHRDPARQAEVVEGPGWLAGAHTIGVTAGASTPNNKIGETVARVCETAGAVLQGVAER